MKPRDQLRYIDRADVYKAGTLAAELEREDSGEVQFAYLPSYEGEPIAFTLPLGTTLRGAGLPSFFAGLLPEGHRLTVLKRSMKTSLDDELTQRWGLVAISPAMFRWSRAGSSRVRRRRSLPLTRTASTSELSPKA
ncbi:HipA N-terminal domain-containing protein [Corynebacterium qintianiae]|uniref:HipA N-terminal domain-containing protein n=1 Tax=Corynebacterium qintianiae TaxID=2709392 RepID=UPI001F2C8178|nr:HipA N-terminal domain-containing protein [Corynebacterium qintianiae]